jgi:DNA-binding winged helix-turn-helix (wHTH) protein
MVERDDGIPTPAHRFRVGDWLVEPELGRIERGEDVRRVEPKVMEVLAVLARSAGELLSKAEITDVVWQLPFISDNRLTGVIADLRRALEDDAANPRYVETIPTRGYRLIAPVQWLGGGNATSEPAHDSSFKLEAADRGYRLREGVTVIGRGTEADLRIDSEWVSRRHARVVVNGRDATIEDLGSKNGTHVNGASVQGAVPLHDGDEIRLGRGVVLLRFVAALGATRTEAETTPDRL